MKAEAEGNVVLYYFWCTFLSLLAISIGFTSFIVVRRLGLVRGNGVIPGCYQPQCGVDCVVSHAKSHHRSAHLGIL